MATPVTWAPARSPAPTALVSAASDRMTPCRRPGRRHAATVQRAAVPPPASRRGTSNPCRADDRAGLHFEGGAAQDPAGKAGCAQMLARLLDEGAGDLTSDASRSGSPPGRSSRRFHAGPDAVGGSLKTLVKHADEAIELLRAGARQAALRRGRDRARPRPRSSPACATSRTTRACWPRAGSSRKPSPATPMAGRLGHGRERRDDHPGRPRAMHAPSSAAAG